MEKILAIILIVFLSFNAFSQSEITEQLKLDYDGKNYDKIISEHYDKVNEYPAKAIYFVGMAYYMKADDENVLKLMELSIKKNKTYPDAHYIKGMTYNFMGEFDKAIGAFNKAIELDSSRSSFYSGLGDSFISQQKYDMALLAYTTATEKKEPIDRPFTMIPQIYVEMNKPEKALEAFYQSKETISKESDSYIIALYNIGLYEILNKNYDNAELALIELIKLAPTDYPSYSKLIQVYYGKKEYEKAGPYREKLYAAYNKGILKDNLKEMFCFDQFEWADKLVQVFEKFEEKEGELYYKHLFYVVNAENRIECRIQTENSPVSIELDGPKYAIGMNKDEVHSTFGFIEENFKYDDLKSIVIQILEKQLTPVASSTRGSITEDKKKKKQKGKRDK